MFLLILNPVGMLRPFDINYCRKGTALYFILQNPNNKQIYFELTVYLLFYLPAQRLHTNTQRIRKHGWVAK